MKNIFILLGLFLISACTVGPDFEKPAPPQTSGYTDKPLSIDEAVSSKNGDNAQILVNGQDIPGEWWKLFRSKPLNDLIERTLQSNPNIKAGQAALKVAQENTKAGYGAYYPNVSGNFFASRNRTSAQIQPTPNSGSLYYSLYTPQLSVSYSPDVFGLNERTVEALKAQEEQTRFALIATNITLTSNVVTAAIQEASLRAQIAAVRENIKINNEMLRLMRNQFAKGSNTRLDVAAQEAQLAQAEASLPVLLTQLAQQRDLLAVLAGGYPGEGVAESFSLSELTLPHELPLSLPSQLIEQRPDIRQAEENLHAASAQIGVAIANRLPNFMLSGDVGSMALEAGQIFANGTTFWTLAGNVTQPIFDGGTLLHKERGARAAFDEAAEQYRSAVLTAFQNVADTLHALDEDAKTVKADMAAREAAKVSLDLTQRQLQSGSANYLAVLTAEQTYEQAKLSLIQAQANRYSDTAALFLALGGGWWNGIEETNQNTTDTSDE